VNRRHVFQVFRKDGLEILRDRRTMFVNIVLPLLLYPMMLLFALQVAQLTRQQKVEPPVVALVDMPDEVRAELATPPSKKPDSEPADPFAEAPHDGLNPIVPDPTLSAELRTQAQELDRLYESLKHARDEHLEANEGERERWRSLRQDVLAKLRKLGMAAAVVRLPAQGEGEHVAVLMDDASRRADVAEDAIQHALTDWRQRLVKERLRQASLPESALHPVEVAMLPMAPAAESIRTRISGILPVLLVVLAASGAFFPALDLIAGERERGTLESLLSWPARRRDVFAGKLLVACVAAAASVLLNICSLGATIAIGGAQVAKQGVDFGGLFSVGIGALALCCLVLLPLTITLAATALAVTGLANSAKEAQNYLTPFFLVVFVAGMVAVIPGTRPGFLLDLIPVVGPVLALKESLQAATMPWAHLALSTAASMALAWVVIGWSARLLDDERFRYPGLVRAGWGIFRKWGKPPPSPGGLEAMGVFAVAVAGFTMLSGYLENGYPVIVRVGLPLIAFTLLPSALHCWLGAYDPRATLSLRAPSARGLGCGALLGLCAIAVSMTIGNLQAPLFEGKPPGEAKMEEILQDLASYGLPMLVAVTAILPGICEELLFRGTVLAGLTRGIGRGGAIVVSAFLFGALHGSPDRFLPQFVLGMFLAGLTVRSGSIVPAMLAHAIHNGVMVVLAAQSMNTVAEAWAQAHPAETIAVGITGAVIGVVGVVSAVWLAKPRVTASVAS
jgi:sodium transport system permease protein